MSLRNILRKSGFDIVRYPHKRKHTEVSVNITNEWKKNRFKLIRHHDIDLVLDVGANDGSFGVDLRMSGYGGQIISYEPLRDVFQQLKISSSNDSSWQIFNFALGDSNTTAEINISGNSQSSSILDMGIVHKNSAPESQYIGKQSIEVKRLDDLFDAYQSYKNIFLKVDVQGYEDKVFQGCEKNLSKIRGIQIEMSLVELYTGEKTFFEHCAFLLDQGFNLTCLEPGLCDPNSGQLLQVDGVWFR